MEKAHSTCRMYRYFVNNFYFSLEVRLCYILLFIISPTFTYVLKIFYKQLKLLLQKRFSHSKHVRCVNVNRPFSEQTKCLHYIAVKRPLSSTDNIRDRVWHLWLLVKKVNCSTIEWISSMQDMLHKQHILITVFNSKSVINFSRKGSKMFLLPFSIFQTLVGLTRMLKENKKSNKFDQIFFF